MSGELTYATVVLPIARDPYTYGIPGGMCVEPGSAVVVRLGKNSVYTGIVWTVTDKAPEFEVRQIESVPFPQPLLAADRMRFVEWMASYYMCTLGEVLKMAIPSTIQRRAPSMDEFVQFRFPTERFVCVCGPVPSEEELERMRRRSPRQYDAFRQVLASDGGVPRSELGCSSVVIRELQAKGLVAVEERECEPSVHFPEFSLPSLSPGQTEALKQLREGFADHATALLHGVTSSGKTEVYMHFMADIVRTGGNVLYLTPEIALTTQMVERLTEVFGSRVKVYHSALSPAARTAMYVECLRSDGGNIIVGARSALFLPVSRLRGIVVDEENDSSYRQTEPSPRYHGRDAALVLASICGARTILGSATPSVESMANVMSGKYFKVSMNERYGSVELPEIIISDVRRAYRRWERRDQFNLELLDRIDRCVRAGEQVILFQNRRGFSPYVECTECGWTPRCPNCNVTLSRHERGMVCHYCGHTVPLPSSCPQCGSGEIRPMGFGTERVEESLKRRLPEARVLRLDGDTASSAREYSRIIAAFQNHEADVLVGTQVVTKGLDFAGVTLIGILNADNLLNAADFRAGERALQTLMQVAGRCGRRDRRGTVIIQTSEPDHRILGHVASYDYGEAVRELLVERERFGYPPYVRLTRIIMRNRDSVELGNTAAKLASRLRETFGGMVIGPVPPLVDRIRGEYILNIVLKVINSDSYSAFKARLQDTVAQFRTLHDDRRTRFIYDVDFF